MNPRGLNDASPRAWCIGITRINPQADSYTTQHQFRATPPCDPASHPIVYVLDELTTSSMLKRLTSGPAPALDPLSIYSRPPIQQRPNQPQKEGDDWIWGGTSYLTLYKSIG